MENTTLTEVTQHKHLGQFLKRCDMDSPDIAGTAAKAWKRTGQLRRNKFILDRLHWNECIYHFFVLL